MKRPDIEALHEDAEELGVGYKKAVQSVCDYALHLERVIRDMRALTTRTSREGPDCPRCGLPLTACPDAGWVCANGCDHYLVSGAEDREPGPLFTRERC